jgi:hypothetical protein
LTHSTIWPWIAVVLLGVYHGLNPGMGWLFAVALGMQERNRAALYSALIPIAVGHLLSVGIVVLAGALLNQLLPMNYVKWIVAAALIGFGLFRLIRSRHPRWVGMRVGFLDLSAWSFLMASAHGSGFMLLPVLLSMPSAPHSHAQHLLHLMPPGSSAQYAAAVAIHTLAYFATTAALAVVVYEKLGLALLRTAWVNLDLLWSLALIVTGLIALLV